MDPVFLGVAPHNLQGILVFMVHGLSYVCIVPSMKRQLDPEPSKQRQPGRHGTGSGQSLESMVGDALFDQDDKHDSPREARKPLQTSRAGSLNGKQTRVFCDSRFNMLENGIDPSLICWGTFDVPFEMIPEFLRRVSCGIQPRPIPRREGDRPRLLDR